MQNIVQENHCPRGVCTQILTNNLTVNKLNLRLELFEY